MRQWNPCQFETSFQYEASSQTGGAKPTFVLGWQQEVSGGNIRHTISVSAPATSIEAESRESLRYRIICHYLVNLVSDKGLPEACESIAEICRFYSSRNSTSPAQFLHSAGTRVRLGDKYDRPAFQATEE